MYFWYLSIWRTWITHNHTIASCRLLIWRCNQVARRWIVVEFTIAKHNKSPCRRCSSHADSPDRRHTWAKCGYTLCAQTLLRCIDNVILSMSFKSDFIATNEFITIWVDAYFGCASELRSILDQQWNAQGRKAQPSFCFSSFYFWLNRAKWHNLSYTTIFQFLLTPESTYVYDISANCVWLVSLYVCRAYMCEY